LSLIGYFMIKLRLLSSLIFLASLPASFAQSSPSGAADPGRTENINAVSKVWFANLQLRTTVTEGRVKLNWFIPSGYVADRFMIQKSTDGQRYSEVAENKAQVKANAQLYGYLDEDYNARMTTFYRIIEFKPNGESKTSEPVVIESSVRSASAFQVQLARHLDGDEIKVKGSVELPKSAAIFMTKDQSEIGVACSFEAINEKEFLLKSHYRLQPGDYTVRIRTETGDIRKVRINIPEVGDVLVAK
jgi:hypothetical protein